MCESWLVVFSLVGSSPTSGPNSKQKVIRMPLFEIRFKRIISGYGGPNPWATDTLTFEAKNKREANKFFKEVMVMPPNYTKNPPRYCYSVARREMKCWYNSVEVTCLDKSKYSECQVFNSFEARVYTQDELRAKQKEWYPQG